MDSDAPPIAPPPPPPPLPPGAPLPPRRRLHRDRANGILGGVCAGVAETFGLDPTLVRALWVVAAFVWIGLPAYVIAWIALPSADGAPSRVRSSRATAERSSAWSSSRSASPWRPIMSCPTPCGPIGSACRCS